MNATVNSNHQNFPLPGTAPFAAGINPCLDRLRFISALRVVARCFNFPHRQLLAALLLVIISSTGCTVLSYDRAMPSLTWYWSHAAREQRAEQRAEKQWEEALPTNSPAR